MNDIDQLLYERISRVERKFDIYSKNPAPTVPIYDLTVVTGPTMKVLMRWESFPGPPVMLIAADTDYLFEVHYNSGTFDWYMNGTLIGTKSPGAESPGITYEFSVPSGVPDVSYPDLAFYVWNLAIGTTRGGSDVFSDTLSTFPTSPVPYDNTTEDPVDSGIHGIQNVTLASHGTVLKLVNISDPITHQHPFFWKTSGLGFHSDEWTTFNIRFPQAAINLLLTSPFNFTNVVLFLVRNELWSLITDLV